MSKIPVGASAIPSLKASALVSAALACALVGVSPARAQTVPRSAAALSAPAPADAARVPADATAAAPVDPAATDPWEGANRRLYRFNHGLDRVLIRPGAVFYHHATPTPIRHGVTNVLSNMSQPVVVINDVLQLKPVRAAKSLARLVINSTVGIGGVFDVATSAGIPFHPADFGQTLGRYGVPNGPYVFLPLLGPTTVRDGLGRVVDTFADPLNTVRYDGRDILVPVRTVANAVDARDQVDPLLKDIDRTATDPYATTRALYLQNRRALVSGGAAPSAQDVQALPDFGPASPAPPSGPKPAAGRAHGHRT